MVSEETTVAVEVDVVVPAATTVEVVEEKPETKGKAKKVTEPTNPKKPVAAKKPRAPCAHPPYEEMIKDAIATLKEKTGSSQYAITKFIEEKQKQLPPNFKKMLLFHLKKLVTAGKITKSKASFKVPSAKSSPKSTADAPVKKVAVKPKLKVPVKAKSAASIKISKAPAKKKVISKPKPASKTKSVAAKPKPHAASKSKAAAKPKSIAQKPKLTEKPAKAARTSSRTNPGKKVAEPKPKTTTKKAPVPKKTTAKIVKAKTVKSPAKKVAATRRLRK